MLTALSGPATAQKQLREKIHARETLGTQVRRGQVRHSRTSTCWSLPRSPLVIDLHSSISVLTMAPPIYERFPKFAMPFLPLSLCGFCSIWSTFSSHLLLANSFLLGTIPVKGCAKTEWGPSFSLLEHPALLPS